MKHNIYLADEISRFSDESRDYTTMTKSDIDDVESNRNIVIDDADNDKENVYFIEQDAGRMNESIGTLSNGITSIKKSGTELANKSDKCMLPKNNIEDVVTRKCLGRISRACKFIKWFLGTAHFQIDNDGY